MVLEVGVLGASSFVGQHVLARLSAGGAGALAFSRNPPSTEDGQAWRKLPAEPKDELPWWICVSPIWTVADHLPLMVASGARRIVALSSTSRFTKAASSDSKEVAVAANLANAEERVASWLAERNIECVILRPTLIYGFGADRNVADIARFIRRFGFFPVLGDASGLRQPVHAQDVADACVAALRAPCANRAYNLSGGETLSYREMVERVFAALGRRPRVVSVPAGFLRIGVPLMRCLPRYRHVSMEMALRMNRDLVFDHGDASRDLGFSPRPFELSTDDVSPSVL